MFTAFIQIRREIWPATLEHLWLSSSASWSGLPDDWHWGRRTVSCAIT